MWHYKNNDSSIAKERLRIMFENNSFDGNGTSSAILKEEIFNLLSRYYELDKEQYDIKLVIKPKKRD